MDELIWRAEGIATIHEFLSVTECDEWMRVGKSKGFEDVPITTGRGPIMMKELRNNDHVMFADVRSLVPHLLEENADDLLLRRRNHTCESHSRLNHGA
jgi:hypothetical protein